MSRTAAPCTLAFRFSSPKHEVDRAAIDAPAPAAKRGGTVPTVPSATRSSRCVRGHDADDCEATMLAAAAE
ncbi:hypothetical protein [Mesorhizobium qingshengii]|uniref:hypothetical protein n=1 Tax=Mesorhizobium qingshengii TaxID=1165689 RepID=UPI00115FCCF6|nr:hypothetical protein [Mesorhizobium qingshengii]